MKLIIGLGNPGEKYKENRHNVGFMVVDKLKNLRTKELKNIIPAKTNTFMNDSGSAVKKLINHYSLAIDHLYIVHDDLDLPLGTWKMQFAKGPEDNGGINSIEQVLGTKDFWRIRVGVDNRKHEPHFTKVTRGEEYVLEDFTKEELKKLEIVVEEIIKNLTRELLV